MDEPEVAALCDRIFSISGEQLDSSRVRALACRQRAYEGRTLVRLELAPQTVGFEARTVTLYSRSVSYLLVSDDDSAHLPLIPLYEGGSHTEVLNRTLGLKLTKDNLLGYLTMYGVLASRTPFYCFHRMSQLGTLVKSLPSDSAERLKGAVLSLFRSSDGDHLEIEVKEHKHFLSGKFFTVRLPVIYKGRLFVASMRIAETGHPTMDAHQQLAIEGIFDEEENLRYWYLDRTPEVVDALDRTERRRNRALSLIMRTLRIDSIVQTLLLPIFVFQSFVFLALGQRGSQVFDYFDRLTDSALLVWASLLFGAAGTILAFARYFLLEFAFRVRWLAPGQVADMARDIEKAMKSASTQLSVPGFITVTVAEIILRAMMTLTLLLYGAANLALGALPRLNFGQALTTIVASLPLGGRAISWLSISDVYVVALPAGTGAIIATTTNVIFS